MHFLPLPFDEKETSLVFNILYFRAEIYYWFLLYGVTQQFFNQSNI